MPRSGFKVMGAPLEGVCVAVVQTLPLEVTVSVQLSLASAASLYGPL